MVNTANKAPTQYKKDYDPDEEHQGQEFMVTMDGGVRTRMVVPVAKTASIEFFVKETCENYARVLEASTVNWPGSRQFREFKACLRGRFLQAYNKIVVADYNTAALQNVANFKRLERRMITNVFGSPAPGR